MFRGNRRFSGEIEEGRTEDFQEKEKEGHDRLCSGVREVRT